MYRDEFSSNLRGYIQFSASGYLLLSREDQGKHFVFFLVLVFFDQGEGRRSGVKRLVLFMYLNFSTNGFSHHESSLCLQGERFFFSRQLSNISGKPYGDDLFCQ